ncbi:Xenotropic and polytropic retrovirus receptor 1-like protein [Trichoplax sp. H2]|nr:Xenotropic and polytropic retrovirus receptor 1-like protein [Trichoplax sp. H2]|eukprot:RDD44460.1 Xenotropic and polytropic retrovirus receptor 1-like protein [Trichoplax sp. H2]
MKFSAYLAANLTPEWRKQYINYKKLKQMIYYGYNERPIKNEDGNVEQVMEEYLVKFEGKFFALCSEELERVNDFFLEKISECKRKFKTLHIEVEGFLRNIGCLAEARRSRAESFLVNSTKKLREGKIVSAAVPRPSVAFSKETKTSLLVNRVKPLNKKLGMAFKRRLNKLRFNLSEFYLNLTFLQNYQTLNHTGFRKILKKYDKMMLSTNGIRTFLPQEIETAPFHTNKQVAFMIEEIENLTIALDFGNRSKAMNRLRVPPLAERQSHWSTFRFGTWFGMSTFLVAIITYQLLISSVNPFRGSSSDPFVLPVWRIFRGYLLFILAVTLLGLNIHIWRISGVNHVLIFELDPRNNLTSIQLMEVGFFLFTICASGFLGFLMMSVSDHPVGYQLIFPIGVTSFMLLYLINPLDFGCKSSRLWLLRILGRIIRAPFCYVKFADFWLADQLNSLVVALLDLQCGICFYATLGSRLAKIDTLTQSNNETITESLPDVCLEVSNGIRPVIACLPAWFRFAQCLRRYKNTKQKFPHLVNAGKYFTSFLVTTFSTLAVLHRGSSSQGPLFSVWIVSLVASTLYTYSWDLYMDWGLLRRNGPYKLLREETVYPSKYLYYLAMIANLVLRFAWTITVSVGELNLLDSDLLITILASFEVFRRFIWNLFRLENEHLNNCGQFRATRNISIKPLYKVNDDDVEDDYDDEDIVTSSSQKTKLRNRRSGVYAVSDTEMGNLTHCIGDNDDSSIKETCSQSPELVTDFNDSLIASMQWIETVLSNRPTDGLPIEEATPKAVRFSDSVDSETTISSGIQFDITSRRVRANKISKYSKRSSYSIISGFHNDEYSSADVKESNV